jgi:hypothetical protein
MGTTLTLQSSTLYSRGESQTAMLLSVGDHSKSAKSTVSAPKVPIASQPRHDNMFM